MGTHSSFCVRFQIFLSYLKICPFNFCFYCHSLIIRFVPNFRFFFPITPCSVCFFSVSSPHYLWNKFSSSALMFLSVSLTREKEREEWRNRRLEKIWMRFILTLWKISSHSFYEYHDISYLWRLFWLMWTLLNVIK